MAGIILAIVFIAVVAVFIFQSAIDHNEPVAVENNAFQQLYTYDEDFSLSIKGYPMVTDYDIRYTESLVADAKNEIHSV